MRWFLQVVLFYFFLTPALSFAYPPSLAPEQAVQPKEDRTAFEVDQKGFEEETASRHLCNAARWYATGLMWQHLRKIRKKDALFFKDSKGKNVLHNVCESCNLYKLSWLLGKLEPWQIKKLLQERDSRGMTPLNHAEKCLNFKEGVALLEKYGVRVRSNSSSGHSSQISSKLLVGGVAVAAAGLGFAFGRRTARSQSF